MDEIMFKRLMFAGEEEEVKELMKMGYFTKVDGVICRTRKFVEETGSFIDAKKEILFEVVKELGDAQDMEKVMEKAGIKDFITFIFLAEELVEDGRLLKDKLKNVIVKQ
ncbi:hypothetical protein [Pelotomaculum propionicicum]|uniref:Uncharacterized protein n=1 Tax=Pelotomaculum propionicicum TaxID=258475 RepID=A0A4Y7RTD7_9FIRM|nr:hypothetical protein [Pelotomaculum propionicicum]NLI12845.1 hypothetical protein [Peptococcaceae bacterium]TEB12268.1 hypothetical protein Pmgp_01159 [Pelotomaculum propionicicum]